jgi:hypothetical protein
VTFENEGLVGKRVVIEFNTSRWPVHKATYIYMGCDDKGYWVLRKDGVQRYFERADVVGISLALDQGDIPETPH